VNELNHSEVRLSTLLTEYGERETSAKVGRTSHLVEYRSKPLKERVAHSHCMHLAIRKRKNERISMHVATNGLGDPSLSRHRLPESHRNSDLILRIFIALPQVPLLGGDRSEGLAPSPLRRRQPAE